MVKTGTSQQEPNDDPNREENGAGPDPHELLRRTERRAERETREFIREMRKQVMRGAAFQAGREAFEEIIKFLTQN